MRIWLKEFSNKLQSSLVYCNSMTSPLLSYFSHLNFLLIKYFLGKAVEVQIYRGYVLRWFLTKSCAPMYCSKIYFAFLIHEVLQFNRRTIGSVTRSWFPSKGVARITYATPPVKNILPPHFAAFLGRVGKPRGFGVYGFF